MKHMKLRSTYAASVTAARLASCTSPQIISTGLARAFTSICTPIASNQHEHYQRLSKTTTSVNRLQRACANTSSGFYAPSNIAARTDLGRRRDRSLDTTQSVVGGSGHLVSYPVPDISKTLARLKETISPVAMNSAEFAQALHLIDSFSRNGGPKLDLLLRKKAELVGNWMTHDWWVEETYLKCRQPLVVHSNPALIYPKLPFEVNSQRQLLNVTSELISSLIDFKHALIHGYNPESNHTDNECHLDNQTCYDQYTRLFGTTRFPGLEKDVLELKSLSDGEDEQPLHFIVSYRGKFFEVCLNNSQDKTTRVETTSNALSKILSLEVSADSSEHEVDGLGALTARCRSEWFKSLKMLDEESIKAISNADFVVCIDNIKSRLGSSSGHLLSKNALIHSAPETQDFMAALGRQVLHADLDNIGNRWFDKTLQLIIVADENADRLIGAGINYEHCVAEGTVVSKLIEYTYDKTVQACQGMQKQVRSNFTPNTLQSLASNEPSTLRQLKMCNENYADSLKIDLRRAISDYTALIGQMDLSYLNYTSYGSNAIKSWRFSPDSWFQVALLSAYFNLHHRLGPCYETASTRRFAYGRTETVRSLTPQVAEYCLNPNFEHLQQAIASHKAYADAANRGEGVDRALLGYKLTFNELKSRRWQWGLPLNKPEFALNTRRQLASEDSQVGIDEIFNEKEVRIMGEFFNNELILRSSKFALSTSQVSSVYPMIYMTYGPITADGYGCCYNITGQQIASAIAANSSNLSFSCDVEGLKTSLISSLDHMQNIVEDNRIRTRA